MFVPILAWTTTEKFVFKKQLVFYQNPIFIIWKRIANFLFTSFSILINFMILGHSHIALYARPEVKSDVLNYNSLFVLGCIHKESNISRKGYSAYFSENSTNFFDIGIKFCNDEVCSPTIRICADNEEPFAKLDTLFKFGFALFGLSSLIFAIKLFTKNKYRLYRLKKYLYFCSSGTINIDLFHYCARKMKSSKHRDEMLQIFNQAVENDPNIINKKDQLYGETCAFQALDAEDYDLLERILNLGGHLYQRNNNGEHVFNLLRKKFEEENKDKEIKSKVKRILASKKVQENIKTEKSEVSKVFKVPKEQPMHR
jgi:hypothetical protein